MRSLQQLGRLLGQPGSTAAALRAFGAAAKDVAHADANPFLRFSNPFPTPIDHTPLLATLPETKASSSYLTKARAPPSQLGLAAAADGTDGPHCSHGGLVQGRPCCWASPSVPAWGTGCAAAAGKGLMVVWCGVPPLQRATAAPCAGHHSAQRPEGGDGGHSVRRDHHGGRVDQRGQPL